jgi:hypothetical protein
MSQDLCKFYLRGDCKFGDQCRSVHSQPTARVPDNLSEGEEQQSPTPTFPSDARNVYQQHIDQSTGLVKTSGWLENVATATDDFYKMLVEECTDVAMNDIWTVDSIRNYLQHTWLRLLYERKVHCYKKALTELLPWMSEYALAFNTGLCNVNNEPVYVVGVQQMHRSCPYIFLSSGILIGSQFDSFLKPCQMGHLLELDGRTHAPERALYFTASDSCAFFNWELPISGNWSHIITQNVARFAAAGVIDTAEINLSNDPNQPTREGQTWRPLSEFEANALGKEYLLWSVEYNNAVFSRPQGVAALTKQLQQCINTTVQRVKRTYSLVVPQYYSTVIDDKYRSEIQMLLPVFNRKHQPVLALSVRRDETKNEYYATTVLPIALARRNARLVAAPQQAWLMEQ